MKNSLLPAIKITLITIVFFSVIYTMIIWVIAQAAPNHGKGEILIYKGQKYYSNIGQSFTADKFFNSRPSAVNYNAAGSGASNKGPSNGEYLQTVKNRIDTFLIHNPGINKSQVPVELVTASGSGLDPDISISGAKAQVPRIAKVRHKSEEELYVLIEKTKQDPLVGFLGPEKVNVLKLNIALDQK